MPIFFNLIVKKVTLFLMPILIGITLIQVICAYDLKAEEFGIEYERLGIQYEFIDMLVNKNITFYINNDGVIKINDRYAEEVKKIMQYLETRPTVKVAKRKHASALALLFNKHGIKYVVREDIKTGETHFMWAKGDDEEAKKITEKEFVTVIQDSYKTGRLGDYFSER